MPIVILELGVLCFSRLGGKNRLDLPYCGKCRHPIPLKQWVIYRRRRWRQSVIFLTDIIAVPNVSSIPCDCLRGVSYWRTIMWSAVSRFTGWVNDITILTVLTFFHCMSLITVLMTRVVIDLSFRIDRNTKRLIKLEILIKKINVDKYKTTIFPMKPSTSRNLLSRSKCVWHHKIQR